MNIAIFCTTDLPTPLIEKQVYAPMQLFEALVSGLADRGHRVLLYASSNSSFSHPNVRLIHFGHTSFDTVGFVNKWGAFSDLDVMTIYEQLFVAQMLADVTGRDMDIVHLYHNITRHLPLLQNLKQPVLATLHDVISDKVKFVLQKCPWRNLINYVSISNNQRRTLPQLNYIETIYNGIDFALYPEPLDPEEYFVFVGRINQDKGADTAVRVAHELGVPLKVIGPLWESDQRFFDGKVFPYLNNKIEYLGFMAQTELRPIVAKAKALLFPIQWEEPFGLVMIEALACGTPVIAFSKGSVPEIIDEGKTGFIVTSEDHMKQAMMNISIIDRRVCQQEVQARFSIEHMVDEYELLYQKLLQHT